MELIRHVGRKDERLTFSCCRLERQGFLNIYSFGAGSPERRHDLMDRGNAAVILPADFRDRMVYVIRQPRPVKAFIDTEPGSRALRQARDGAESETFSVSSDEISVWELPAGMVDGDETPLMAARRELREETGLDVPDCAFRQVAAYYPSIGATAEKIHAFIADVAQAEEVETRGDGWEQIEVWKMSWDEAFGLVDQGRIETASSSVLLRELKIIDLQSRRSG